jgi:mono/diheme cytochrome c family protein
MFSRFRTAFGIALLLSLVFAIPAFAGGWAVITLDELPTGVVAGEPLTVGFTVLQHGRTPMDGLEPTIVANLYKEQEFVVYAEPDGKPGHYTAALTFPREGEWRWIVRAFSMEQQMPLLAVAPPAAAALKQPVAETEPAAATIPPLLLVRGLAVGIGLVAFVAAYRRRSRLALALTVLCLLAGIASFLPDAASALSSRSQGEPAVEASSDSSASQVELGRQLFIAKGCITCHYNSKAANRSDYWTIEMGAPDLSKFTGNADVLFMRLKDPASVKSDTKMPNLGLSRVEIEALVAFINSK